jgi:uncharacterized membrane protein
MEIFLEILEIVFEAIFNTADNYEASRWKRLVAYILIFIMMAVLFYLSYVVRTEEITKWFFILLGVIMAVTLIKSFPEIRRLIRNEEV